MAATTQDCRHARDVKFLRRAQKLIRRVWRGIRDWCGDSAYERYLSVAQRRHPQDSPLSEKKFYVEQLNRRYSRPNRCC